MWKSGERHKEKPMVMNGKKGNSSFFAFVITKRFAYVSVITRLANIPIKNNGNPHKYIRGRKAIISPLPSGEFLPSSFSMYPKINETDTKPIQ